MAWRCGRAEYRRTAGRGARSVRRRATHSAAQRQTSERSAGSGYVLPAANAGGPRPRAWPGTARERCGSRPWSHLPGAVRRCGAPAERDCIHSVRTPWSSLQLVHEIRSGGRRSPRRDGPASGRPLRSAMYPAGRPVRRLHPEQKIRVAAESSRLIRRRVHDVRAEAIASIVCSAHTGSRYDRPRLFDPDRDCRRPRSSSAR